MTPFEYEVLIEKVTHWGDEVYLIQDKMGDGDDGQVQKLKLEMFNFKDQLKRGLEASKVWSNNND